MSIEFFILIGFAFLALIVFLGVFANGIKDLSNQKESFLIKDLAAKLQKEVNVAASVNDGYYRSFELPERLDGSVDYFVITYNRTLTVNSSNAAFSVRIPIIYGKNFTKGTNTIEKEDGKVYVNR